jgi:hypothetical protein
LFKAKKLEPIQRAFLFDLKNPWAFIYELNSSHPLVAKRIKRIEKIKDIKAFDFDKIEKYPLDKEKLYKNFLKDIFFELLPFIFFIPILISPIVIPFIIGNFNPLKPTSVVSAIKAFFNLMSFSLIGLGLSIIAKTLYRYSSENPKKTTILELMGDIYASPIRGVAVELDGAIVGRGVPGLIVSEDMMFQDETGLIYLDYEGIIPFFGNIVFALTKLESIIGKNAKFLVGLFVD